jgi:hypothetical protein
MLTDILSRRELLYRQVLEKRNKIIELPNLLRATPKNPLIKEVQSSFLLVDPITYNSEYSREMYYNSLSYFKHILFKGLASDINSSFSKLPINLKLVNDYLFFHFLNQPLRTDLGQNKTLFKSQFRPMRKGVTNMIRLHATSAIAMPIEIRLQILASSRDVIHS